VFEITHFRYLLVYIAYTLLLNLESTVHEYTVPLP